MNFPFGTNGKFIFLGVPILKHIRVYANTQKPSGATFQLNFDDMSIEVSCIKNFDPF